MMKARANKRAFSLVELIIVVVIIGVIAAIAVPRISRGAKGAGDAALRGSLAAMRNAIDMYAAEHQGKFPDTDAATVVRQLTEKTDKTGAAGTEFGPYLRGGFPPLPVDNKADPTAVKVITSGSPAVDNANDAGWVYSTETGEIIANTALQDENSVDYSTY